MISAHLHLPLLAYMLFLGRATGLVTPVTKPVCESNGLCFMQNPVQDSLSEVGFAFPRSRIGVEPEMLVSMKVQLPYGFAGIMPGAGAEKRALPGSTSLISALWSVFATREVVDFTDPAFLAAMNSNSFVIQVSDLRPNHTFVPTGASGITPAPGAFFVNASFYRLVTRFQGAAMRELGISPDETTTINYISSMTLPTYITNSTDAPPVALFDASPADVSSWRFELDGKTAQFENYTEMLKAAGLS
ncbi:hypothetical protein PsYK624_089610 [Phanerochaete sordida]|uniref:Uncharacterized protein n=1 Tax=Phanerochaete sordida TaxID=48140 RepID=A0A9P3GED4_9APHY|nr:hypothetical protein PsYK624_089610 [Phanerochaete sordida]